MKRATLFFASMLALSCWFLNVAGLACTATRTPPEKLCEGAPVVVRATATRYLKAPEEVGANEGRWVRRGQIEFKVLETLKGEQIPTTINLSGFLTDKDDFNEGTVPYQDGRLGTRGGCYAENYRQGAEFLLFLTSRGEEYMVLLAPLSAANEQLRSADDPWLIWVRNYLRSQKSGAPENNGGRLVYGAAPATFWRLYRSSGGAI